MAAVDMFLKIDGIDGESKDDKHAGSIQLESFSFGATNQGSFAHGGGGGAGKVAMQDIHFVKQVDKASPVLFERCAKGDHIKSAKLTVRKAGGKQEDYLVMTFGDLLISSTSWGGNVGSPTGPTEQVSIAFTKVQTEYKEQKADGGLGPVSKGGWDVKLNKVA